MAINEAQKTTIAQWLSTGDSLSDVQSKLKSEFGVSMTFMEVRFLIDDLNLELQKKTPIEDDPTEEATEVQAVEATPEGVTVEVDVIVTPGSLVSGSVQFTDGTHAKWQLDQMGRLGLSNVPEGYQPSPEDVQEFQTQLQVELRNKGYG